MLVNKLVRDKVPENITDECGKSCSYETLPDDDTYREALTHILLEETQELVNILRTNHYKKRAIINEIVDIKEVLRAIAILEGIDMHNIAKHQSEKRNKKGSFKKRIFLKEVM